MSSDQERIDALRRRDSEAQRTMLEHCDRVCAKFCRNYPHLNEPALGLAAYEKLLAKIDKGEPIKNLEGLITLIAKNTCIDALRKWQRAGGQPEQYLGNESLIERADWRLCGTSQVGETSDQAEQERRMAQVQQCMDQLDPDERQIAEWYKQGKGPTWIAKQLGHPANPNNITQRWYRIRRSLARCCGRADDTNRLSD